MAGELSRVKSCGEWSHPCDTSRGRVGARIRQSCLGNGGLECSGRTRLCVARSLGGDSFAKALLELVGLTRLWLTKGSSVVATCSSEIASTPAPGFPGSRPQSLRARQKCPLSDLPVAFDRCAAACSARGIATRQLPQYANNSSSARGMPTQTVRPLRLPL